MRVARIFNNLNKMSKACAQFVYDEMNRIFSKNSEVSLIISGDIIPDSFYKYLGFKIKKGAIPRPDIYWFLANEIWETPEQSLTQEYKIRYSLFSGCRCPEENVFNWQTMTLPLTQCADKYNASIHNFFTLTKKKPGIALLTIDENGAPAALYPQSRVLTRDQKIIPLTPGIKLSSFPVYDNKKQKWFMTLSDTFISQAETIIFMIMGKNREKAFANFLAQDKSCTMTWLKGKQIYFYLMQDVAGKQIYNYKAE